MSGAARLEDGPEWIMPVRQCKIAVAGSADVRATAARSEAGREGPASTGHGWRCILARRAARNFARRLVVLGFS